ncbi:hypothetical protein [Pseudodesulfovibrio pelocollis]|uniref:hypothetical protein n=1 Tax=Pseudodesulfovibrio pelocollis TaxID=3051432 RepID=UPI00255B326B|nr:hypothetical protein [Pseudodesulfovibrio sp. SB368]
MKIYSCPASLEFTYDYSKYFAEGYSKAEEEHKTQLLQFLKDAGYTGENTGRIYKEPVADGYAMYMYADTPTGKAILIHLPYGDSYSSMNAQYVPKEEILRRIEADEQIDAMFSKGGK